MRKRTCTYVVNIIFTYESTAGADALVVSLNLNDVKLLAIIKTHMLLYVMQKKYSHASK